MVVLVVLGIFAWSWWQESRPRVESGKLEFRMITGEKDGVTQVILIETADRFTVLDSLYRDIFGDDSQEIVSRPEQLRLMESYTHLQYRVGMKQSLDDEHYVYRLSRELFNQVLFGPELKFEVAKKQKDTVVKLVE